MNTPTLEEICKAYKTICQHNVCAEHCPLKACYDEAEGSHYITCNAAFIKDVLTGKRNLDGSLIATEKCDKLPDWVRSDALCVDKYGKVYRVHTVTAVNVYLDTLNGATRVEVPHSLFANGAYKQYDKKSALPSWCKVGQWCFNAGGEVCRIESKARRVGEFVNATVFFPAKGKTVDQIIQYEGGEPFFKPVRFREYMNEEAKAIIGECVEMDAGSGVIVGYRYDDRLYEIGSFRGYFADLVRHKATIDGVPIGVPEVDEEAMKEVE